jgi:hypothetical protein
MPVAKLDALAPTATLRADAPKRLLLAILITSIDEASLHRLQHN